MQFSDSLNSFSESYFTEKNGLFVNPVHPHYAPFHYLFIQIMHSIFKLEV